MELTVIEAGTTDAETDARVWVSKVLERYARAEQAIGSLCIKLNLPIANGLLTSLSTLQERLIGSGDRRCRALNARIERWRSNRPYRHLLAHGSLELLFDATGSVALVTRHLPRDADDVTPDRLWSVAEREELLRQVTNHGRSICDHARNILADPQTLHRLRAS